MIRSLKRLWQRLRRRRTMTVRIYGEALTGETRFYCSVPDDANIYEGDNVEWQRTRDRIFNTPNKGTTHHG